MADNNGDDVENSDLEINEIGEVSGELFGNDDSNEEFNDYEMDSTDESDHETDIDTIDDTKWRNNNRPTEKYRMFTGKPGIQKELPTNPTYVDYFALFMANHHFEIISTETNR